MLIKHSHHRHRAQHHFAAALTLLELLIVLMVLIAVAGIVVPNVTSTRNFAQQTATEQTLINVRTAILGADGKKGLWHDLGERDEYLPLTMADLFITDPSTSPLSFSLPANLQTYDPNSRLGWRGPYLMNGPTVLDGWGHPVVIQTPDAHYIRLVSTGEDGVLDTPPAVNLPPIADCGDDVVLFLRVADTRTP